MEWGTPVQTKVLAIRRLFTVSAALSLLLCAAIVCALIASAVSISGCDTPSSKAINQIAQYGVATSKPLPDGHVRVFVVQYGNGREKQFGDQQLLAILPLLPQIDGLDELDLHDSSVSDASIVRIG
jgi:hypothetical protein